MFRDGGPGPGIAVDYFEEYALIQILFWQRHGEVAQPDGWTIGESSRDTGPDAGWTVWVRRNHRPDVVPWWADREIQMAVREAMQRRLVQDDSAQENPVRRNGPDERARRAERSVSGSLSLEERQAAEAQILRAHGMEWRGRVPSPKFVWRGGARGVLYQPGEGDDGHWTWHSCFDPLTTLDNDYQAVLVSRQIERWLLNRLILGDFDEDDALALWHKWAVNSKDLLGFTGTYGSRKQVLEAAELQQNARFLDMSRGGWTEVEVGLMLQRPLEKPDGRPYTNPPSGDQRMRALERRAQLGDQEAQAQLHAAQKRSATVPTVRAPVSYENLMQLGMGPWHHSTPWLGPWPKETAHVVMWAAQQAQSGHAAVANEDNSGRLVQNLGYLMKNNRSVTAMEFVRGDPSQDNLLFVYLDRDCRSQGIYVTRYASEALFRRWVSRRIFSGVLVSFRDPDWVVTEHGRVEKNGTRWWPADTEWTHRGELR